MEPQCGQVASVSDMLNLRSEKSLPQELQWYS